MNKINTIIIRQDSNKGMEILPHQVHLWFAFDKQINNSELLQKYYTILNYMEREQQKRFHFEKHRHQYLITRALVRSVLSLYQPDISPNEWQFRVNKFGRPYINNKIARPLYFNLSHTDALIILAVSLNSAVGVDVELLERKQNTDISKSVFTAIEYEQLRALPAHRHNERFYKIWTLKESYIKARGKGLSMPLKKFSFHFSDQNKPNLVFNTENSDDDEAWQFWHVQPNETHIVSLAVKTGREYKNCYDIITNKYEPFSTIIQVPYPVTARV